MSISSNKYINIVSGVGGAATVSGRELLLRVFTTNELVPTGSTLNFTDAASVLDYFGSTSEEYLRASQYFGFVSKAISSPKSIDFSRWANVDTSAKIFGAKAGTLTELNAITSGAITLTLAGVDGVISVDFSSAASYADVATELQTNIQAVGGDFAASTVAYNALKTQFIFSTNGTADGAISVSGLTSVLSVIGWDSTAAFSAGVTAEPVTDSLSNSYELSNNFGSYVFTYESNLDLTQCVESAAWNITHNNEIQYHIAVLRADVQSHYDALNGYAGCAITIKSTDGKYHEELPCALLATQDFSKAAAAASYMYVQDATFTPTVTTTTESNELDLLRCNYYGETQFAGSKISFYQRGTLMGGTVSPSKMGVFANEQWLKSDLKAEFFNMFLALPIVSADDYGVGVGFAYISASAAKAVINGTISQGKKLTTTQIQYVNQISGRDDAHFEIASKGYWFTIEISEQTTNGVTEYALDYTFIYAKRDAVDSVSGRHILI